jgi:hypothetical protein
MGEVVAVGPLRKFSALVNGFLDIAFYDRPDLLDMVNVNRADS